MMITTTETELKQKIDLVKRNIEKTNIKRGSKIIFVTAPNKTVIIPIFANP